MEKYDYMAAVCEDVRAYIEDNGMTVTSENRDEVEEQLNEDLFIDDNVTGNASNSYTFNSWQAEENICHNLELLQDANEAFGGNVDLTNPEACDVTIRCYLLRQAISSVLDEVETDEEEEEEE